MDAQVGQKVGPGKEIMAVYARISVMEKLRPQEYLCKDQVRTRKAITGKGNVAENEPRTKGGQDKPPD